MLPIHLAAASGLSSVCEALAGKGVDVEAGSERNGTGGTALVLACKDSRIETAKTLVRLKANVNAKCDAKNKYRPCLGVVCVNGCTELAELLLDAGADFSAMDQDGDDCLQCALGSQTEYPELVRQLIEKCPRGVSPFTPNNSDRTSLHRAAASNFVQSIEYMLRHKLCSQEILNMRDCNGDTALHNAVTRGHTEVARLIIESGASIDIKNNNGRSSIELARSKSREMSSLLESAREIRIQKEAEERERLELIEEERMEFERYESSDLVRKIREILSSDENCKVVERVLYNEFQGSLAYMQKKMKQLKGYHGTYVDALMKKLVENPGFSNTCHSTTFIKENLKCLIEEDLLHLSVGGLDRISSISEKWEDADYKRIRWEDLRLEQKLGEGSFGKVVKARYRDQEYVAVKVMTSRSEHGHDFEQICADTRREASVIYHAGNNVENNCIVKLKGVCQGKLPSEWSSLLGVSTGDQGIGIVMRRV